ncbi:MAG: HNH endonuclease [Ilumatobacter sp.]|uniref:HNH endonuclease n=1 Tax=Ilumatobacter sp. TaxID=1967498 RepID=UPI0032984781
MTPPVLLLDATWRIDRVIGVNRACCLLAAGEAVAASDEIAHVMRSPSTSIEIPSVIARTTAINRRSYRPPGCTARRVRLRDAHTCQFVIDGRACDALGDSVDHLHPRSLGGDDAWLNLVASCKAHNNAKANRTLDQMGERYGWRLRRAPFAPTHLQMQAASICRASSAWEPFLGMGVGAGNGVGGAIDAIADTPFAGAPQH